MNKQAHTTKSGPGRKHVEGTNRGSTRIKREEMHGWSGAKLARKALAQKIGVRS